MAAPWPCPVPVRYPPPPLAMGPPVVDMSGVIWGISEETLRFVSPPPAPTLKVLEHSPVIEKLKL